MPRGTFSAREKKLQKINEAAPQFGRVEHLRTVPFGSALELEHFRLGNGLDVLLLQDSSAPVIAFHAWFRVGSRHERPGKTGISHLFEHLMFNEVEGLPAGAFDQKMEAAGADNNASTWLDFTQYQEAFPKKHLKMVIDLEARRMKDLVLRDPQVLSEKEVVKNERRYRVEDDVDGTVEEMLWKTAFERHSYHWPTIGWMQDIEGFTTEDCLEFYKAFYAPNNASLILVGDLNEGKALALISEHYGAIAPSEIPAEDIAPEPPQTEERRVEMVQPTPTEKLAIGYKSPALGDQDHLPLTLLLEVLTGGRASRLRKRLIRQDKLATEAQGYLGPHSDPSLAEFSLSAREGKSADAMLSAFDEELKRVREELVSEDELRRAKSRVELGLLSGLETADGKASNIGFYHSILGRPAAAFERTESFSRIRPDALRRVARRYLTEASRTVVKVVPGAAQ